MPTTNWTELRKHRAPDERAVTREKARLMLAMLRERRGLSQAKLAQQLGTSQSNISQIERGEDLQL